jgi:hypothetical protein
MFARISSAFLSVLLSLCASADTVISQNGFEYLRSKKKIEEASCCLVEVRIINTVDDYFSYWTAPQIAHDASSAKADEVKHDWKQKMPRVISGPDTYLYTDEFGETREVDLRWAVVHHLVEVEKSMLGDYKEGDLIIVQQPGSTLHNVKVQNMDMMMVGEKYQLYLKSADYWENGVPVHRIAGLSGGMQHLKGDKKGQ